MIEFDDVPVCHVILDGGDYSEELEPGVSQYLLLMIDEFLWRCTDEPGSLWKEVHPEDDAAYYDSYVGIYNDWLRDMLEEEMLETKYTVTPLVDGVL